MNRDQVAQQADAFWAWYNKQRENATVRAAFAEWAHSKQFADLDRSRIWDATERYPPGVVPPLGWQDVPVIEP